jgi:hypothetical protein
MATVVIKNISGSMGKIVKLWDNPSVKTRLCETNVHEIAEKICGIHGEEYISSSKVYVKSSRLLRPGDKTEVHYLVTEWVFFLIPELDQVIELSNGTEYIDVTH